MIKIEQEFDQCVDEIGGIKISELVGSSPDFFNADYLFPQYEVIAELKCLEEDKIKDKSLVSKASAIYLRYLSEGKAPKILFGTQKLNTTGFPEEFTHEITELYRKSIHTTIKKANNQIKQSKDRLKMENHHGLLILANDRHTALAPANAMWILHDTFRRYSFSSINTVLYFTANLKAEHPEIPQDILVWIPVERDLAKSCPEELLSRLQKSWFKKMSNLTNEPVFEYHVDDSNVINDISNK
ncbi:MAG: hypothetical protein VX841_12440 [Pseudomonadota bacterium]|nr:hypothetical protein [Pseudomonadota bacterium]